MANAKPQISVVIPSFNGKRLLEVCLPAVMKQNAPGFEVIVVDNGSSDGTAEFVKSAFSSVALVHSPKPLGFCAAVNMGINVSQGAFIATLNNDTEVHENWLNELFTAISSNEAIGFCASKILFYNDRNLIDTAGDAFTTAGFAYKRGFRQEADLCFNKDEFVFGACAGAALYRRELFDTVGLFDEDFFAFNEDVDLSFRAQLAGFKCLYVPKAIVYHFGRATFGKTPKSAIYYGYRNLITVIFKNIPARILLICFPSIAVHALLSIISLIFQGHALTIFKASFDGILTIPNALKKRRQFASKVVATPEYIRSILDTNWLYAMAQLSSFANKFYPFRKMPPDDNTSYPVG